MAKLEILILLVFPSQLKILGSLSKFPEKLAYFGQNLNLTQQLFSLTQNSGK